MRPRVKISLISTLLSLLIICVLFLTQFGFHVGLWLTKKLLPGNLSYTRAHGLLIGPISADNIRYSTTNSEIKIKHLYFQWSPTSFLFGKLHIKKLAVDNIVILQNNTPDSSNSKNLQKSDFPFHSLRIDNAKIHQFDYNNEYSVPNFDIQHLSLTKKAIRGQLFLQVKKPYPLKAKLELSGKPEAYQFNLLLENRAIHWRVMGDGSPTSLDFHNGDPKMLGGDFMVNAQIDWKTALNWNIHAHIKQLELKQIQKDWPQRISLNLTSQGSWPKSQLPIFTIEAQLISGSTLVMINGFHNQGWNLQWNIDMPDMSYWIPTASGQIKGAGSVIGPSYTPKILGKLEANNVSVFNLQASQLNFTGDYDLSYRSATHINLSAKNLLTPQFFLNDMSITADGNAGSHQIQLNANLFNTFLGKTKIFTSWEGNFRNTLWNYRINQFNLDSQHFGSWRLSNAINFSANSTRFTTNPFCFESSKGKSCFKGNWSATQPWNLDLSFHHVDLTPFFEHWRPGLSMRGSADLFVDANGQGKNIKIASMMLTFNNAKLSYNGANGLSVVNINTAMWSAQYKNNTLKSTINLQMPNHDYLIALFNVPKINLQNFSPALDQVTGSLDAEFKEVKLFNIFIPDIFNPSGRLIAHLKLNGTLKKPVLSGSANLINGKVAITDAKINFTNVNASIATQGSTLLYSVKGYSDRVPLTINGKTDFAADGLPTQLSIRANHLLVINTIEYQIYASPNLNFIIKGNQAKLDGTLLIPEATLAPISFSSSTTLPDDTTIIGNQTQDNEPLVFESNVKLVLGDAVNVRANGLTGKLRGNLEVSRKAHQTVLANGQLDLVDGNFTTHGKSLTIVNGSGVTYVNTPLSNPTLNIKATRSISVNPGVGAQNFSANNITVGVQILGSLRRPQISLFSIPSSLSQADILSYLLFGTPSNSNGPSNVSILLDAITSLNLDDSSEGNATSKISQSLGLAEFGVEQQTSLDALGTPLGENQSSFVVGRYLSPKIYVRYSRGLLISVNILQVRYLFNKNWAVQSDTSSLGTGGDILYTIQR